MLKTILINDDFSEAQILQKMNTFSKLAKTQIPLRVMFFSSRPDFFSMDTLRCRSGHNVLLDCFASYEAVEACKSLYDLAIVCNHVVNEQKITGLLRYCKLSPLVVAWTWDNHHSLESNLRTTALTDIVLPGHAFSADGLHLSQNVVGRHIPLCTGQWSPELATKRINLTPAAARSSRLYGGYVNWPIGERPEILARLLNDLRDVNLKVIEPSDRDSYFRKSGEARFDDWSSHKVHLVLSVERDLSCRLFDSLLAGQIPLVSYDCADLDEVISPEQQKSLPIVRYSDNSTECVKRAWARGVELFDSMNEFGVLKRHQFALDNHHAESRLGQIVDYLVSAGDRGSISLSVDENGARRTLIT